MSKAQATRAGRAFVELFTDNTKLEKGLRAAEARVRAFGAKIARLGSVMIAAGAAITAPLAASTKYFSSYGDQVAKMAKRTGLSVEMLSELRFVASQTGTEFGALESAFRRMQRSIYDAGRGLSTQVDALNELGLSYSDLADLSPEEQFKLLGDAIGKIENDTKQAAVAMMLFGRAGTNLIPMFEAGADGITALQLEARRLGLTMSGEDAKAAEVLTDAMDALWKTVKMVTFHVGAALAKSVGDLSKKVTEIASATIKWVKENRGLVVSVAKIAAGISLVGASLLALGITIKGLSLIYAALATVIGTVTTVFSFASTVIMSLNSPLMLVIAAAGAGIAALLAFTDVGRNVLASFGEIFKGIGSGIHSAVDVIGKAVASGKLDLAFKVAWTSIKLSFAEMLSSLKMMFVDFKTWWDKLIMQVGLGLASLGQEGKIKLVETQKQAAIDEENFLHRMNTGQVERDNSQGLISDQEMYKQLSNLERVHESKLEQIEQEYKKKLDAEKQTLADLNKTGTDEIDKITNEGDKQKSLLEEELAQLRARFDEELFSAERELEDLDTNLNGREITVPDIPDLRDLTNQMDLKLKRSDVSGTFNAAAVAGIGPSVMDRIEDHSRKTAKNTEKIVENTKNKNSSTQVWNV